MNIQLISVTIGCLVLALVVLAVAVCFVCKISAPKARPTVQIGEPLMTIHVGPERLNVQGFKAELDRAVLRMASK